MPTRKRSASDEEKEIPIGESRIIELIDCDGSPVRGFATKWDNGLVYISVVTFWNSGTSMRSEAERLLKEFKSVKRAYLFGLGSQPIELALPPSRYRAPTGVFA